MQTLCQINSCKMWLIYFAVLSVLPSRLESFCMFTLCVCPSAGEDRPQRFQTGLRCPLRRLEFGNHTGEDDDLSCDRLCVWYWKWFLLHCCFSMNWPRDGSPTRSGTVCSISWRRWWRATRHSSAALRRDSSPPNSSTSSTCGETHTHTHMTAVTLRSPAFPLSQSLLTQQRGCNNSDSLWSHDAHDASCCSFTATARAQDGAYD